MIIAIVGQQAGSGNESFAHNPKFHLNHAGETMNSESSAVLFHIEYDIPISAIQRLYGSVPRSFSTCFVCKMPAQAILCGRFRNPMQFALLPDGFPESSAEALAQELRADLGTEVELPVCEIHRDGGLIN